MVGGPRPQQTPMASGPLLLLMRRLSMTTAMLPCVLFLLLLLVGPATAFLSPSQPRSPASSLQVPLQPLPRLAEGEASMAGRRRGRPRADLSRLMAAGKGFGKNVNKGGADDGGKKPKQQPSSSSSSSKAGGSAQGQAASGGVVRPPLGDTVHKPQGEVPRKFQMLYTCNICDGRNLITVDRVAFTEGIVVAKCKHCDAKHLVADNLSKLDFGKGKVTLDDILALRGEKAERVDLSSNPDLAKYNLQTLEDGTVELMPKEEGQA